MWILITNSPLFLSLTTSIDFFAELFVLCFLISLFISTNAEYTFYLRSFYVLIHSDRIISTNKTSNVYLFYSILLFYFLHFVIRFCWGHILTLNACEFRIINCWYYRENLLNHPDHIIIFIRGLIGFKRIKNKAKNVTNTYAFDW